MAIFLGVLASITYGCADFLGGLFTRRAPVITVVLVSQVMGTLLLLVTFPFFLGDDLSAGSFWWGAAAGVTGATGVTLLYRGLGGGRMSVVAPITGTVAAALPVVVGLVSGERPSALALTGVGLALAAVVLVSSAHDPATDGSSTGEASAGEASAGEAPTAGLALAAARSGVPEALGAGTSFGLFFVFLDQAGDTSGLWPLVGARVASMTLIAVAALVTRAALRPPPGTLLGISFAGVFDVAANLFYLLAARRGLLTLVAVLTSMYPGTTVVLARIVLKERLRRLQLAGLVLAGAGIVAMAVG